MAITIHNHIGASSPTDTDFVYGEVASITVRNRGGAATVTVTEPNNEQRTLVTLSSGTADATINLLTAAQDNSGNDISNEYVRVYVNGRLRVTSNEDCEVLINYDND